jgi:hypothetical protein
LSEDLEFEVAPAMTELPNWELSIGMIPMHKALVSCLEQNSEIKNNQKPV